MNSNYLGARHKNFYTKKYKAKSKLKRIKWYYKKLAQMKEADKR